MPTHGEGYQDVTEFKTMVRICRERAALKK